VENEDLVNIPNWLPLMFRVDAGDWFSPGSAELLDYRQELDMRAGMMSRRLRFKDPDGRVTAVTQSRLVSMRDPHLAGLRTTFEAENWTGRLTVRAALDGRVTNTGVERNRDLASAHLSPVTRGHDDDLLWLQVETTTSRIRIAEAAQVTVDLPADDVERSVIQKDDWIGVELGVEVAATRNC
jgi:trehalose/maltose hydrolase-like predicted phosphorylase